VVTVVQGFGPFGSHEDNPSELLVRSLDGRPGLVTEVLPVSREQVADAVAELMARHRPSVWIGVGLAAGRTALSLEAVAVNLAGWPPSEADIDGKEARRQPVVADGPAAHLTTLPVEAILGAWKQAGVPGYLSQTAGSYLCNLSFYAAAQAAMALGLDCRVGFVHVPLLPEHVDDPARQPSMAMPLQAAGLEAVIEASQVASDDAGLYLGRTV
jgi:pyroglutamyl-peptidase